MIILLMFLNAYAASTAHIQLQGVVPRIIKQFYSQNGSLIIQHNFPIEKPANCVRMSEVELSCVGPVDIVAIE